MKARLALPLLLVASSTASCAAQRGPLLAGDAVRPAEPATHAPIVLGDKEGRVRLTFPTVNAGKLGFGTVQLRAFDEILLGPSDAPRPAPNTQSRETDSLRLDNQVVRATSTNAPFLVERSSSNNWEYASVDLVNSYGPGLKQFKRHLLHVRPDLFVICDEISPSQPSAIDVALWFPQNVAFDPARDEWRLQTTNAGLTTRLFGSPRAAWRSWVASDVANPGDAGTEGLKCLRSGVTNKVLEFRQITVLVPHEKGKKRSLAFKLLESETAIGVRVHRDGLPTLIAFRKSSVGGEANLTGLKFTGPVGVDVFSPKRKQVEAPQ
jgi:hypothetical protein